MRNAALIRILLVAAVAAVVAVVSLVAYGFAWGFDNPSAVAVGGLTTIAPPATTSSSTTSSTTSTTLPPTTTTYPRMPEPPAQVMPAVPSGGWGQGASGDAIKIYEQRLGALHFDPGPADGVFDRDTRYSIEAVQKLWGLPRTGRIDADVRNVIGGFKWPQPLVKHPEPDRVEIDLDHQVIVVWKAHKIILITTTSTGSGRHFCGGDNGCQYAVTPPGDFKFQWHYNGWRKSKLGQLWNPYYFNGGIAVHGYTDVPVYPASHGCTRIPMHIANYFASLVHVGEAVHVVGKAAPRGGGPTGPVQAAPPTAAPTTTTAPLTTTSKPPPATHPTTTTKPPTTTTKPPTTTTHPVTTTT